MCSVAFRAWGIFGDGDVLGFFYFKDKGGGHDFDSDSMGSSIAAEQMMLMGNAAAMGAQFAGDGSVDGRPPPPPHSNLLHMAGRELKRKLSKRRNEFCEHRC